MHDPLSNIQASFMHSILTSLVLGPPKILSRNCSQFFSIIAMRWDNFQTQAFCHDFSSQLCQNLELMESLGLKKLYAQPHSVQLGHWHTLIIIHILINYHWWKSLVISTVKKRLLLPNNKWLHETMWIPVCWSENDGGQAVTHGLIVNE